jgi:hypothetical protein
MKRLDQGHLYLKLGVPRLTCSGRKWNPGLCRKEPLEQLTNLLFGTYKKLIENPSYLFFNQRIRNSF